MKLYHLIFGLALSALVSLSFATAPAMADEDGYGEDIRSTVFGSAGHHGDGRNGRTWIPRHSGAAVGILRVYRTQAVININANVYWTHDVRWNDAYTEVCVNWPPEVPAAGRFWQVRKNDDPDLQFTVNSPLPNSSNP